MVALIFIEGVESSDAPNLGLDIHDPMFAGVHFVVVASRFLASTLSESVRQGVFATLTLPLRRSRLWNVTAAALGRGSLDQRVGGHEDKFAPPSIEEARAADTLILVAEDNATNQIVIQRLLTRLGYAHEIVDDGGQALAAWRIGRYGLLLTDFHMPEMDGFALTRAIRTEETQQGGTRRLPIVALTADVLPGTRRMCLDTGMDGYLSKPIEQAALIAELERILPGAKALRRRESPTATPSPSATATAPSARPKRSASRLVALPTPTRSRFPVAVCEPLACNLGIENA